MYSRERLYFNENSTLKNKQYPLEKIKPSGQKTVQKINRKSKDKPEGLNEKKIKQKLRV